LKATGRRPYQLNLHLRLVDPLDRRESPITNALSLLSTIAYCGTVSVALGLSYAWNLISVPNK